jgi:hypothetical protein
MYFVQRARKEAILPKVSASPVESIDVLGVELIRAFQGFGQRGFLAGRHDKMDVIGHQTVAVNDQIESLCGLGQKSQKHPPVVIYEKDVLAVIAALGNVMRTTCNDNSWT